MSIIATNTDLNLEVAVEKGNNHSDDTSSDETDRRREKPAAASSGGGGRSYECTFCKRGFTNAQALGGHMNIHRKDKLKAKQKSTQESSSPSPLPNSKNTLYTSSRYLTQISTDQQQQRFCPSPRTTPQLGGYMFYPSYRPAVDDRNLDGSRPGNLGLHGDLMEANLTLRIGQEDGEEEEESKEELEKNEVDLELRLGRHHKYS